MFIILAMKISFSKIREKIKAKPDRAKLFKVINIILAIMFAIFLYAAGQISSSIVNKSVYVWRNFHANLRIIEPFITPAEVIAFRSKFSQITTKEDYQKLAKQITIIAEKNKITLRND
jgi:predicted membrane protein